MFTRVEESWENPGPIDHEKSWDLRSRSWTSQDGKEVMQEHNLNM